LPSLPPTPCPNAWFSEGKIFASRKDDSAPILNLEQGHSVPGWGRVIFYVADVDAFWEDLRGKGFNPESPRDASWGERYFLESNINRKYITFERYRGVAIPSSSSPEVAHLFNLGGWVLRDSQS
jgi:hypothetical protein